MMKLIIISLELTPLLVRGRGFFGDNDTFFLRYGCDGLYKKVMWVSIELNYKLPPKKNNVKIIHIQIIINRRLI